MRGKQIEQRSFLLHGFAADVVHQVMGVLPADVGAKTHHQRTVVYTTFARISNDGAARFLVDGPAPVAGGASKGFEVGVRHRF